MKNILSISLFSILLSFNISCSTNTKNISTSQTSATDDKNNSIAKETVNKNKTNIPTTSNETETKNIEGNYTVFVGKFTGGLEFKVITKNNIVGSIKFNNWGTGKAQPVKDLRINGRDLYFIRSITTTEERKIYGAKSNFKHIYRGKISKDGKTIIGKYKYRGGNYNWRATKVSN